MKPGVYVGPAGQLVEVWRGEAADAIHFGPHSFQYWYLGSCGEYLLMGWEYLGEL